MLGCSKQWAKGHSKIFLRGKSQWRLENWPELSSWALRLLSQFRLLAIDRGYVCVYACQYVLAYVFACHYSLSIATATLHHHHHCIPCIHNNAGRYRGYQQELNQLYEIVQRHDLLETQRRMRLIEVNLPAGSANTKQVCDNVEAGSANASR